jgi:hypothetical protein
LGGHGVCWISKKWAWLFAGKDEDTAGWMITGLRASPSKNVTDEKATAAVRKGCSGRPLKIRKRP